MEHRYFGFFSESVGHQARCSQPKVKKGNLTVFLVITGMVEVGELGFGPQGVKNFFTYHVEAISSSFGTILFGQPVPARLLYRDACAPHPCQTSST